MLYRRIWAIPGALRKRSPAISPVHPSFSPILLLINLVFLHLLNCEFRLHDNPDIIDVQQVSVKYGTNGNSHAYYPSYNNNTELMDVMDKTLKT